MTRGAAFDVQAVCSGFIYALAIADNFISAGQAKNGARHRRRDHLAHSRLEGPHDLRAVRRRRRRGGADGSAGAGHQRRIAASSTTHLFSDGRLHDLLYVDGGPSTTRRPAICACRAAKSSATPSPTCRDAIELALKQPACRPRDIDWFVPHQANQRILDGDGPQARRSPDTCRLDGRRARQHFGRLGAAGAGRSRQRRSHQTRAIWC